MALDKYRGKRDFKQTPEPPGAEREESDQPLRFVVHKHHATRLHWDLRLELDGVLKSWAVPKGPSLNPDDKKLAVMVEDHPIDYQTFEGVIPKGNYGAGPVMIWDRGTYHAAHVPDRGPSEDALRKGLAKGHLSFVLEGERLKGEFALVRLRKGEENSWLLLKKGDEFTEKDDAIRFDTSVATGRTMAEIEADEAGQQAAADGSRPDLSKVDLSGAAIAPMPAHVKPMLATLVEHAFDKPGWLFEIKWDGYRALAEVRDGVPILYSRRDNTFNERFPSIVRSLESLPFDALFDGEIVVTDESGRADFQSLQDYKEAARANLVYYVFDLLHFDGFDLTHLPLVRRKEILGQILPARPHLKLSEHIEEEGVSLFQAARQNMVEGIVAKDGMSPYRQGQRSKEWLKIKTQRQQEAVIAGFTAPRGGRKGFGSLVLGAYEKGRLIYIGHTGGGFTDRQIRALMQRLEPIVTEEPPFDKPPEPQKSITWVQPALVCEVRFAEWTKEGLMRQPVFLGLREDLDPAEVQREIGTSIPVEVAGKPRRASFLRAPVRDGGLVVLNDAKVQLTNPDKVFWPEEGYTKGDVVDYYRQIAPYILPYLLDRPESMRRHPDGIAGESFFQKNVEHLVPDWVRTVTIRSESEGKDAVYLLCQDEATLIYMANLGCVEINPWHSRIGFLEAPDFMVLDIDPLDVPFSEAVRTAIATREVLKDVGAGCFCKTSGARGLHIYVPLGAKYSYDQSTQFAKLVYLLVHNRLPHTTSLERSPEKRRGKVYLDYLQNSRGQTLVAPYCLRPRKGAPVSTPLLWSEVNEKLDPGSFTIKTTVERLKRVGDLWKGVIGPGIDMAACLGRVAGMLEGQSSGPTHS